MTTNRILLTLFLLLSIFCSKAQEPSLHIIARPLPDSILIRWAPTNYKTWDMGNQFGYKLIRYTILRDSNLLSPPERTELNSESIKPWELNNWETLVKTNKYAGIAAQGIYGKTFEVDAGKGFNPEQVVYKAKEQNQRFAFALYAADMSPAVAKASALWLTDKSAKKNEKYLYRVFISLPDSLKANGDTAYVFTGISEYEPLPLPVEFQSEFDDHLAKLSWNTFAQNNIYVAWEVERSDDKGRNFTPISPDAIVPLFEGNGTRNEYTFKFDSLPQNGKEYQFRLRGISSFGEIGPWSKIEKGKGIEAIKATANIKSHKTVKKGVELFWEFPVEMESTITGFKVLRSENDNTGFTDISGKLKANKRDYFDKKPIETAYYKVMAYRDTTAQKLSYPYLVMLVDSIPPHKPTGLSGIADTAGVVTLSWQPNKDADIYGYRVYRSASGKDEFSQLTHTAVAKPFYTDTLNKRDLNKSVFYKIVALDLKQNQSGFSNVAEVTKADIIAPSIPVITDTKATEKGIQLHWINSTSTDVAKHQVYRKLSNDTSWQLMAELPYKKGETTSVFTDEESSSTQIARYQVVAIDKSGNISSPTTSVDIKGLKSNIKEPLSKLQKQVDSEHGTLAISWQKPEKAVLHYKVYRKSKTTPYALYETIEGSKNSFEDYKLKLGDYYAYRIKVVYEDGSVSGFTKEISVQF